MYEFSVPMPFRKEHIDNFKKINKLVKKSRIRTFYFALPASCSDCSGFEQLRVFFSEESDFSSWAELIKYSLKKGFDFVYLLNSPKSFLAESKILDLQLEKLDRLLLKLKEIGCNKLRISNTQLLNYILDKYPDFKIYASTSFEYTNMKQFKNFLTIFPQVVEIVPSFDINRNFKLLKNLKKAFPNTDIELMVNEGCISGCPFRMNHFISVPSYYTDIYDKRDDLFKMNYFVNVCNKYYYEHLTEQICLSNIIYPWEIEEYGKIGINKFKLVGRNSPEFKTDKYFDYYLKYLQGIDDYSLIENEEFRKFNHYLYELNSLNVKVYDIKKYLPDIKYFINNGHLCSSICSNECRYCYNCADKIKKSINIIEE